METFSKCGIDKLFMSILGIDKLCILFMDTTYAYDVDKAKISTS